MNQPHSLLNLSTPYQTPNLDTSWEELKKIAAEQAELIRTLQAQSESKKCCCHIIDPSKMRILLWINRHQDGKPDTCVLKIAEQRLLGLPRSDRRGETYWRFDEIIEPKSSAFTKETPPQTSFKCDDCQAEVVVIGADNYQEEIRQRAALKKELAEIETKEEPKPNPEKVATPPKETSAEPKSKRQALKEQISQAIKENQQAELKAQETQKENASQ